MVALTHLLDGILWINLDRRTDRRSEMEEVLRQLGIAEIAERFSAIPRKQGILGCGLSHLACLRLARERGWRNVLILEDDFLPLVATETFWIAVWGALNELERKGGYDVLMLAHLLQKAEPFGPGILKVVEGQTASAYIVHRDMLDRLITLYEEAMPLLESTGRHWDYANDQIWKRLQPSSRWYALEDRLGRQRPSYSDNSQAWADYGA